MNFSSEKVLRLKKIKDYKKYSVRVHIIYKHTIQKIIVHSKT